ncbi:class I SAM-dependent methyltransferase [Rhizobium sp. RCAM05350]|nr:class I SAM-dependent methyltransferase [Rhizobium sp. RCAM05350]
MMALSARLLAIVEALPLRPGLRVIEIGCGPGAMAREIASRIGGGHVLAIDRSATAIAQAVASSHANIAFGRLAFRHAAVEDFVPEPGEAPYDLAVAIPRRRPRRPPPRDRRRGKTPDRCRPHARRSPFHRWRRSAARSAVAMRLRSYPFDKQR